MKILLTGFEPYGAVQVNPSEQIVRRIAARARSRGDADLFAEVLPTEFRAAGRRIRQLIRAIRPAAVLCLGVAPSRNKISLERVALNLDDDPLPDNAVRVRLGRPIGRDGPVAYWSTLPLARLRKALDRQGIPVSISNHAGAFVCNHVFYVARHEVERMRNRTRCGFLHVPPLYERGKNTKVRGMTLRKMVEAVEGCLGVLGKT